MTLIDQVKESLENLKTLEIRTVVGNFNYNDKKKITYNGGEAKSIITQIDLLEGDITTAFSEEFLQPPYDKIREYHAEKEKQSHEIIEGNMKALKEFINLIKEANKIT